RPRAARPGASVPPRGNSAQVGATRTLNKPPSVKSVLAAPVTTTKARFVALHGRPNAGKPTLLNRLVGAKLSIVSPRPQTTRHRITGLRSGRVAQAIFVDTPGLRAGRGELGEYMQKTAEGASEEVDLVCLVVDAGAAEAPGDFVLAPLRAF